MSELSAFPIKLIVGLGNPGPTYLATRHNAGAWLIEALAQQLNVRLQTQAKFFGRTANNASVTLLSPDTYMNQSGKSVAALAQFYKIPADNILIAHDDLDIPAGQARFKTGGGTGGHNGLKDIVQCLGNNDRFHRLRIGIGRPAPGHPVIDYVLGKPPATERAMIDASIVETLDCLPAICNGQAEKVMNRLHRFHAP